MRGFFIFGYVMAKFGTTSRQRLATCHQDLQLIFNTVIDSYDHSILCGHRDESEQNQAFIHGLSQVAYPNSKHNSLPSMAVDAGPYFVDIRNVAYEDHKAFAFFAGYVKRVSEDLLSTGQITHRIRWGGDWDSDGRTTDEGFLDLPHFELIPA